MIKRLRKGDKVSWTNSQGEIQGTVQKQLTKPRDIKGHHVAASSDNLEIIVKSDKTGAIAAHKPNSIRKSR